MSIEDKIFKIIKRKKNVSIKYLIRKFGENRTKRALENLFKIYPQIYIKDDRIGIFKKGVRVRGRIEIKRGNYGFLIHEKEDIFIPGKFLSGALDGDYVEVEILEKRKGKRQEGRVVRILERMKRKFIGTVLKDYSGFYVFPDEGVFPPRIEIVRKPKGAELSENLRVTFAPLKGGNFCEIIKILGDASSPHVDYEVVIEKFGIRREFPDKVLKFCEKFKNMNSFPERTSLTNLTLFTIDPETAKDFDDAISCERFNNGFKIGVHIADVSFYTSYDTPLFKEAYKRGNSFYLLDKVIPMLPGILSSNLCSLLPKKERLSISVFIFVDKKGRIKNYEVFESIIKSKARLNYDEAQNILEGKKINRRLNKEIYEMLKICGEVASILKERRHERGSLDFDMPEPQLFFDKEGKIEKIKRKLNLFSHSLIEEFMVLANRVIALHLEKSGYPFIYRIHEEPDPQKIKELELVLKFLLKDKLPEKILKYGISSIFDLQNIIENLKGDEREFIVKKMILRSMKQAKYSIINKGHYGLGLDKYLHFTSPIRRFPDLVIHNILKGYMQNKRIFKEEELEDFAEKSTIMERIAQQAEWDIVLLKSIDYLKEKMGEVFEGIISKVTGDGFYVSLLNELVDVFIPLRELKGKFKFIRENFTLLSKNKKYSLGDKINLMITRIVKERKYIEGIPILSI
ncbi:MAG: ribonuclease R [candidate division WOR-3 bacterium]